MKAVNLKHLSIVFDSLTDELSKKTLDFWNVHPKTDERGSIVALVHQLEQLSPNDSGIIYRMTDNCYFGFTIPRISKEFDCLWIGNKTIVDVELKSQPVDEAKICRQLKRNKYYLRCQEKDVLLYAFVSSNNMCYTLDGNENLVPSSVREIGQAMYDVHKEKLYKDDIEDLFTPEKYLVSPFNSTQAFLQDEYFLTDYQQAIKDRIVRSVCSGSGPNFLAVTGGPGSGKTLLLYDIAKTLMSKGKRVVVGHGGGLNEGHYLLNQNGWSIYSTKYIFKKTSMDLVGDADVYFIDEAQRSPHIDSIQNSILRTNKKCVFAFDQEQVLNKYERRYDNGNRILSMLRDVPCFQLNANIRMNQAVYEFVHALFDMHCSTNCKNRDHVDITYCANAEDVENTLFLLKENGYVVPRFTPMLHSTNDYESWFPSDCLSAHQVIGQEFDDIVGLVSPNMFYGEGRLVSKKAYYYYEDRMLFQILSRARNKIHIVIYANPLILERCLSLIK